MPNYFKSAGGPKKVVIARKKEEFKPDRKSDTVNHILLTILSGQK